MPDIDFDKFEHISKPVARVLQDLNPEGYAEFQLRQAIADAVKMIGKERALEIFKEEAA